MRIILTVFAVVFTAVWLAAFSVSEQKTDTVSKITALENKWCEAYKEHDVAAVNSLLADDFIITVEDGNTYGKQGYVAHSGDSSTQVEVAEMQEMHVRLRGNVAIVTGAYHEKGKDKGKPYEYHDRFTDTWINTDGKWEVLASHYSVPVK
jgi:ketosteroid isomerase-like protein